MSSSSGQYLASADRDTLGAKSSSRALSGTHTVVACWGSLLPFVGTLNSFFRPNQITWRFDNFPARDVGPNFLVSECGTHFVPKMKYIKAWGPLGRRRRCLLPFIGTRNTYYVQTKFHEGLRTFLPGLQACASLLRNTEPVLCLNPIIWKF
jgi:hypothetical protein